MSGNLYDPGTPEARRAWLDSLPDGAVIEDSEGVAKKHAGLWLMDGGADECVDDDGMRWWCEYSGCWPARLVSPGRFRPGDRVRHEIDGSTEYGVVIATWPVCGERGGQLDCRVAFWAERPRDGVDPGAPYVMRYYASSLERGWGEGGEA